MPMPNRLCEDELNFQVVAPLTVPSGGEPNFVQATSIVEKEP